MQQRRDVTVWLSSEAIAAWTPRRSGRRGGQRRYSDLAIETALTLRLLYHLPLRQAEGFLHALFGMMRLNAGAIQWPAAPHPLARRRARRDLRRRCQIDARPTCWEGARSTWEPRKYVSTKPLLVRRGLTVRMNRQGKLISSGGVGRWPPNVAFDAPARRTHAPVRLEFPILSLHPGLRPRCVAVLACP